MLKWRGFTLIELLVVVTIIGLLAPIAYISTPKIMARARDAGILQDFHQILNLAEKINLEEDNYDPLCLGDAPCNKDLQKIDKDITKQKGTLVVQKPETPSQSYCAFSPLNVPEEGRTQYYCVDNAGGKIKTTINPGVTLCTNVSFRCPTQQEQLAFEEKGGGFAFPLLTAEASVFSVSTRTYPYFKEVTIDPLDVSVGDIQKMLVKIEDPDEINWIRADIEHDNGIDTVMLALFEGNLTKGTWAGQWRVHDTHKNTYRTIFTAQNRKGKQNSITLAWTDPCSPPVGGNWTLDDNCSITGVNGVDNGNFTVSGNNDMVIKGGATWVINPGKSMTLAKDGSSITIEKTGGGGQMKKTYLWMVDADVDKYASSTASSQYYGDTAPTVAGVEARHRYDMASSTALDYNDRDAAIYFGRCCNGGCTINQSDGTCGTRAPGSVGCTASTGATTTLAACQQCDGTSLGMVGGGAGSDPGGTPLSCSVAGSCANTTVFKIYATTGSHAEITGSYSNYVCCSGNSLGTSGSGNYDTVLRLSGTSNAHAEKNTLANSNYSTNKAYLSTTYGGSTIKCSYVDAADCSGLGSLYTCLASISGTTGTNAHVGPCTGADAYTTKVCCANICPDVCVGIANNTQVSGCDGTCQACQNDVCGYATAGADPGTQCTTAAAGQPGSCQSPNCSGIGASCGYLGEGEQSQPACKRCSGSSYDPVNIANNTQDTESLNVSATCQVCDGAGGIKSASDNTQTTGCNSTCQACKSGVCSYADANTDPGSQCTQGSTASDGCTAENCSGTSAACAYQTTGEGNCPVCKYCSGATSIACVNRSNDTQDTTSPNTCTDTCKKCSSGICANQGVEDLFSQCSDAQCYTGNCGDGSGACAYQTSAQDLYSYCGTTGCYTDNCIGGSNACGYYSDDAEHNCTTVCTTCYGATSGNCVNYTNNTQDTTSPNTCSGTCQACKSGVCSYADPNTDPGSQCVKGSTASDGCASDYCSGTSAVCGVYTSGDGGCPVCQKCTDTDIACENYPNGGTKDTGCTATHNCCSAGDCIYNTACSGSTQVSKSCSTWDCKVTAGCSGYCDDNYLKCTCSDGIQVQPSGYSSTQTCTALCANNGGCASAYCSCDTYECN